VGKGRTGRWKVIGRHPSYHGMTLVRWPPRATASAKRVRAAAAAVPEGALERRRRVVKVIEQEAPATIAAFVAEADQGAAERASRSSDEYWRVVTQVCKATTSCSSPTR
jgi:adenosylmethionine-8-amino-7-oxononanoate aminotransferase